MDELKHCKHTRRSCSGQMTETSQVGPAQTFNVSHSNWICHLYTACHTAHTCVDNVCAVFTTALAVFFTISDVCNRLTGSSGLSFNICKQSHITEPDASDNAAAPSKILLSSVSFRCVLKLYLHDNVRHVVIERSSIGALGLLQVGYCLLWQRQPRHICHECAQ